MEENDGENNPPELQQVSLEQSEDLFQSALEEEVPLDNDSDIFAEESVTSDPTGQPGQAPTTQSSAPTSFPTNRMHRVTTEELQQHGANGDDQYVRVSITEPQKMGEGMSSYMAYRVSTQTNMQFYKKSNFSVYRRFSDFLGLHDKLIEKYLRSGRIIPPAPEKSMIGSTKIKISNQADQGSSGEFIERRRAALERFINRTANHPILRVDPDFRDFLESELELPKATNTSALSGAGVIRLFNKVGETVNKITYKMDESDVWFEEKVQQIDSLDNHLKNMLTRVEALVYQRRELCLCLAGFSKSIAMLSNCDEHNSLSRALSILAEVEEKVEHVYSQQCDADYAILYELLKDYVALVGAVKDVFHERVKVYQNWQHAQIVLNKKREAKAKFEIMGRTDKINQAKDEVLEWESKVERGQEEFENICRMIKKELERFELVRTQEFKVVLMRYVESLMNNQQQLIQIWETFLPEAKAIA
ncbi:sorting nexin-2-like [Neocloeon triangulifer]|uniref:sorting nexin-2-like n=1 Tax=Neocloeon triangulifer TaxID=2078957 RepID=UPI00286EBA45|nr:sorting nexin-2-like [Neocloeon triangulifer]